MVGAAVAGVCGPMAAGGDEQQPAPQAAAAVDAREAEVRDLIARYFDRWSAQDIDGYGACFAPGAVVQFIDASGRVKSATLDAFLESQRDAHRRAPEPMVETAESVDIAWKERLAHVMVRWKLRRGAQAEEFGYDHFTLQRVDGRWRIVHLVFYADE